jgi:hypothetical protein
LRHHGGQNGRLPGAREPGYKLHWAQLALLIDWQPDIVLAAGPPLYLTQLSSQQRKRAWENGLCLAHEVETLILDHHLLRCEAGQRWLERLMIATEGRVCCAADFMERLRRLLEARRIQLYSDMPVSEGWHEAYAIGKADTNSFQVYTDANEHKLPNLDV